MKLVLVLVTGWYRGEWGNVSYVYSRCVMNYLLECVQTGTVVVAILPNIHPVPVRDISQSHEYNNIFVVVSFLYNTVCMSVCI